MNWDWIFDIESDDWMLMDLEYGKQRIQKASQRAGYLRVLL